MFCGTRAHGLKKAKGQARRGELAQERPTDRLQKPQNLVQERAQRHRDEQTGLPPCPAGARAERRAQSWALENFYCVFPCGSADRTEQRQQVPLASEKPQRRRGRPLPPRQKLERFMAVGCEDESPRESLWRPGLTGSCPSSLSPDTPSERDLPQEAPPKRVICPVRRAGLVPGLGQPPAL